MNAPVGYFNYIYFVLFLIYMFLGCTYFTVVTSEYVFVLTQLDRYHHLTQALDAESAILICFTVTISASLSVGILLVWHIYLIATNQTTIEFYINMENRSEAKRKGFVYKNPFNEGMRKNFRRVFGDTAWYWYLVPCLHEPMDPMYAHIVEPGYLMGLCSNNYGDSNAQIV